MKEEDLSTLQKAMLDSWDKIVRGMFGRVEHAMTQPHVLLKPTLSQDGNMWCVLLGENLQEGLAGFGDTPEHACIDFNRKFKIAKLPAKDCKRDHSE